MKIVTKSTFSEGFEVFWEKERSTRNQIGVGSIEDDSLITANSISYLYLAKSKQ